MTQVELDGIITSLCQQAGLSKSIDLKHAAKVGTQVGGEWEFDWRQKGQDGILLTITYWHNSVTLDSEDIFIPWEAMKSDNQLQKLLDSVVQKIDNLKSNTDR